MFISYPSSPVDSMIFVNVSVIAAVLHRAIVMIIVALTIRGHQGTKGHPNLGAIKGIPLKSKLPESVSSKIIFCYELKVNLIQL